MKVSKELANKIYDILLANAGAREGMREMFVNWLSGDTYGHEFRFQGVLGFGGKFWSNPHLAPGLPEWYVTYYPEDKTRGRDRLVTRTNKALAELRGEQNRIIFLDIDGVLNTGRTRAWPGRPEPLDAEAVINLNAITDATGAKIVVSSTWRLGTDEAFERDVVQFLKAQGVKAEIIGRTPSGVPGSLANDRAPADGRYRYNRGDEIAWKAKAMGIETKNFVILDDDADMKPVMDRLVQTDYKPGLTADDAKRAIEKFNLN